MTKKYIDADILRGYMKSVLTGNDLYTKNGIEIFVESLPAADVEHEMAVILADLFGCPLDYDIGEDLCEVCDFVKGILPCTNDDVACWEQYLKHRNEVNEWMTLSEKKCKS